MRFLEEGNCVDCLAPDYISNWAFKVRIVIKSVTKLVAL